MRDVTSALPRSKPGFFNPQKSAKTCLAIERCGISTRPRLDLDPDHVPLSPPPLSLEHNTQPMSLKQWGV